MHRRLSPSSGMLVPLTVLIKWAGILAAGASRLTWTSSLWETPSRDGGAPPNRQPIVLPSKCFTCCSRSALTTSS